MKKFFILATYVVASLFATKAWAADRPTTAPAAPTKDVADVKAIFCNTYTENNYYFDVPTGAGWQQLTIAGIDIRYTENFSSCTLTNTNKTSYDCSGYPKFHFDVWAPEAGLKIYLKFKGTTFDFGIDFGLNEGWNTIDADLAWWTSADRGGAWDFKDLKEIIFYDYKKQSDNSTVNKPFAFTNLYFWKESEKPVEYPSVVPTAPTVSENTVIALYSASYTTNTLNFAPTKFDGRNKWSEHTYENGQKIFYTEEFYWDGFGDQHKEHIGYNISEPIFETFHIELYTTVASKIQITFEALNGAKDSKFREGKIVDLEANKWNAIDIDLLNPPFGSYDFRDIRFIILDAFKLTDGTTSAEGNPLGIANVYFYNPEYPNKIDISKVALAVENIWGTKKNDAVKKIVNGQLVIEKDGKRYNALGVEL